MILPPGSHSVRICSQANLGDNGQITADCFTLHPGTDSRPADRYLSVHWLEYFGSHAVAHGVQLLREFLLSSKVPGERKPSRNGRLAVLSCDSTCEQSLEAVGINISFRHIPRNEANAAPAVTISPDGVVSIAAAHAAATESGQVLDPHSGVFTLPEQAPLELAVQQFLASQVVHSEPGLSPL